MARNLLSRDGVGETSAALTGLGNFVGLTQGVALGYHLPGFQPFCISVHQRQSAVQLCVLLRQN
jgi:hypothetical protein